MPTIEELTVKIEGDTKGLRASLKDAEKTVRNSTRKIEDSSKIITNSFSKMRFAAIGAGFAIVGMGRSIFQELDQFQKLSIRLGESTENLSRLKFISEQSGVEFRATAIALQRMQRRISEAARGSGEAKDALLELNLVARDLNKIPLLDQFLQITSAIESLGRESERTRILMKLFDSEGVALAQIMDQGAEAVRALARETTNVIKREDADRISNFNDEVNKLKGTFRSLLIDAISPVVNEMNSFLSVVESLRKEVDISKPLKQTKNEARSLGSVLKNVFSGILEGQVRKPVEDTSEEIENIGDRIKRLSEFFVDLASKIKITNRTSFRGLAERVKKTSDEAKVLNNEITKTSENINAVSLELENGSGNLSDFEQKFQDVFSSIKGTIISNTNEWSENLADALLGLRTDLSSLSKFVDKVFSDIARNLLIENVTRPLIGGLTDITTDLIGGLSSQSQNAQAFSPIPASIQSSQGSSGFNSQQVSNRGSSLVVNQNFSISSGADLNLIDQKIANAAPLISAQAQVGVVNALKNGGNVRANLSSVLS